MATFAKQDLTQGKVSRQLAIFAWPLVLTNLLQTLFSLTDLLLAGRFLGSEAMSAVAIGGQSVLFLLTFSLGLTAGGQILIAQLKGAEKAEEEKQSARVLLILSIGLGITVALLGFFLAPLVLRLLQTPEEAWEGALQYMRITSLGLVFAFVYNAVTAVLRGQGDARRPLLFAAVAAALHLGFGLLFVGFLSLGIPGVALATVLTQAAAASLSLLSMKVFKGGPGGNFFQKVSPWQILRIGLPFGAQMCLLNFSNLFIVRLVNSYGVTASAALGAGARITNVLVVPMLAIGNAASTMVGQNLGAGHLERAGSAARWAVCYALTFSAITTTLTLLLPTSLISLFTDDPEVLQIGVQYLTTLAWCYAGHALHSGFNAAILGAGLTLYSLAATGVEALVGRMGLTALFSGIFGLPGIFFAQTIAPYLAAALSFVWYLWVRWQNAISVNKSCP